MSRTNRVGVVFACAAAVSAGGAVRGDVLVTNLAEPFRATTDVGNNPNPVPPPSGATEWSWAAQSFVVDAQSYSLTRIDIIGGDASKAPAPVVVAELREDNAGAIGALITTLTASDLTGTPSARTLTPDAPVTLDASATYWVVLGSAAPGDGTLGWSYANSNESVGTGVIGAYADSQDSGANWNYGTDFPYYIQVVAEPTVACGTCEGDANGDSLVDFNDIVSVLGAWGGCPSPK